MRMPPATGGSVFKLPMFLFVLEILTGHANAFYGVSGNAQDLDEGDDVMLMLESDEDSLSIKTRLDNINSTFESLSASVFAEDFPTFQRSLLKREALQKKPSTAASADLKCEPKVLDEEPLEPFYDFSDITEDAARQFADFLVNKFPSSSSHRGQLSDQQKDDVRRQADSIASSALNEDSNLLAFALAAPSIQTMVVRFRDNVTIPLDKMQSREYLAPYWRELSLAWNGSSNHMEQQQEQSPEWGVPFRDCHLLVGRWLWPFRMSFTESKFKIVIAAFIAADEDVCNDGLEQIFGRKHGCDRNTTFCLLTENKPSAPRNVYTCICRESFYLPNSTLQGFRGDVVEMSEGFNNYSCIPCPDDCASCDSMGVCLFGDEETTISLESLINICVGSILGTSMFCCLVLSVIVFRCRKSKPIASGLWTVLETLLLGILLLYASVAVHLFPASTERCLLEPWLRELGFIICYGAIILKLYRHLVDFRTRKAHRWVLRDVDLLKYLGIMVFAGICYMAAFTVSAFDLLESSQMQTLRELRTNTCIPFKCDLVTQVSEILILCFGLNLAYITRNASTQFKEKQCLVATLVLEFVVSLLFYLLRYIYLSDMSPSTVLLALFIRSQLTNTFALCSIFLPKLWFHLKRRSLEMPPQRHLVGYAGFCVGDPDVGELSIAEMNPEDICAELKRLYTQLEILKNKTLRQDNPHISKRRGGRKAGHRRFSLQKKALSAKHRNKQPIDATETVDGEHPSRTPEDSVCSIDVATSAADAYAMEIASVSHPATMMGK